jgi:hypothetical protein
MILHAQVHWALCFASKSLPVIFMRNLIAFGDDCVTAMFLEEPTDCKAGIK